MKGALTMVPPEIVVSTLSLLFVAYLSKYNTNHVEVHVSNGAMKGEEMTSETGDTFYSFRGIPFAEPPVGNLRFKAPVPKGRWKGVLDATKDGPICSQISIHTGKFQGDEDCLYLNVYTPKLPRKDGVGMDVIFHIPGGGFNVGAGNSDWYGPRRFKLDNIILVSMTYRLSIFGFLSTKDSAAPGNYGLLDQLEALRWVYKNIHQFGGDPQRITLLGESAGSASVLYHFLSPLSQGMFHRVVAMSGSVTCNWALQRDPIHWAKEMGNNMNCPSDTSSELVECLRGFSSKQLLESLPAAPIMNVVFVPTVDDSFVVDLPRNLLSEGKFNKSIPILIGSTKDEGACIYAGRKNSPEDFTDEEIETVLQITLECRPRIEEIVKKVKEKYFSSLTSYNEAEVNQHLAKVLGDGLVYVCIYSTAKTMIEAGSPVYVYSYDYEAELDGASYFGTLPNKKGACHADDLFMLFEGVVFHVKTFTDGMTKVKNNFQKMIISFSKTGAPIPEGEENVDCKWPQAQVNEMFMYHIDDKCSVDVHNPMKDDAHNFWTKEIAEMLEKLPVRNEL